MFPQQGCGDRGRFVQGKKERSKPVENQHTISAFNEATYLLVLLLSSGQLKGGFLRMSVSM